MLNSRIKYAHNAKAQYILFFNLKNSSDSLCVRATTGNLYQMLHWNIIITTERGNFLEKYKGTKLLKADLETTLVKIIPHSTILPPSSNFKF